MDLLTPGNVVTIKVRNALYDVRHRYANGYIGPEFETYTGTVVSQPWYGPERIGLTSDVRGLPVRVISRERIVEVGGAKFEYEPIKSTRETITVTGSKGQTYIVTKENGKATCTCPGFTYRKTCKHVENV